MPTKSGNVDQNSHFSDSEGKHWHLTEDHPGAPSYSDYDLSAFQGQDVVVRFESEDGHWLTQVTDVTSG